MTEDSEHVRGDRVERRTFLRTASLVGGAGLLAGRVEGTDPSLYTGVYVGPDGVGDRPMVVYRRPARVERTICNTQVSWQHRVAVPPRPDGGAAIYADLYAPDRFRPGSILELVDRLSACPRAEGTRIFLRRVDAPE